MDKIIQHMSVPMIQGALRSAYKVNKLNGDSWGSKEKAEGAVFAAAILPMVHSFNSKAATTISNNMKIDSTTPMKDGFAAVKSAFESTYSCLGITCSQVGGFEGSATCTDIQSQCTSTGQESTSSRAPGYGVTDIVVISVVVSLLTLATQ